MHDRITRKLLEELTDRLNQQEERPRAAYTRDGEGQFNVNPGHVKLDFNPYYGGYRLDVMTEGGGEDFYWPRWSRISGREMYQFLMGKLDADR